MKYTRKWKPSKILLSNLMAKENFPADYSEHTTRKICQSKHILLESKKTFAMPRAIIDIFLFVFCLFLFLFLFVFVFYFILVSGCETADARGPWRYLRSHCKQVIFWKIIFVMSNETFVNFYWWDWHLKKHLAWRIHKLIWK